MQPYFFPYLGYYQMAAHVDAFVFFDDVHFIKKGFINRNQILSNGQAKRFTVPVRQVSQNRRIHEHEYTGEFDSFLALVERSYRRAPHFETVFPMVAEVVAGNERNVARVNARSIEMVLAYLGIQQRFSLASVLEIPDDIRGQDRILAVCELLDATHYINASGGRALYNQDVFEQRGLQLQFFEPELPKYGQGGGGFVNGLSILDAMMWCAPEHLAALVSQGQSV